MSVEIQDPSVTGTSQEEEGSAEPVVAEEDLAVEDGAEAESAISEETQKPVPYAQFQKSRHQLRETKQELVQAKQQLQQLTQWAYQVQAHLAQQQRGQPEVEEELIDPVEELLQWKAQTLQERKDAEAAYRQEQATAQLESELTVALTEFPDASPNDILNGLHANPKADVKMLAKKSQDAFYAKADKRVAAKKTPPPVKPGLRTMPGAGGIPGGQAPKSWGDTRAAALAMLGND